MAESTMADTSIYRDIANRTGGNIYIGVVGPVRTGKSTLIKRFLSDLALPNIQNETQRERARDEMPQSAAGKTVMTTEPKFIPEEAVRVSVDEKASFNLRLIDCVGYLVEDALGSLEDGTPRMVMTPWSSDPMPFELAAETGTHKVIADHATIGILVTTDGSICDIPRESYVAAEQRVAHELTSLHKPFAVVLNSAHPNDPETQSLASSLRSEYGVPVLALDCLSMSEQDIRGILSDILYEFPVKELDVSLPPWLETLEEDWPLKAKLMKVLTSFASGIVKMSDVREASASVCLPEEQVTSVNGQIDLGEGRAEISVLVPPSLYFSVLGEKTGVPVTDEASLLGVLTTLADTQKKYDRIAEALRQVEETGYGIVTPTVDDLKLEEPEIVRQPGGYGVKLKASAPSVHMIRVNVSTEVSPIVGSEKQSEELMRSLLAGFEEDPHKLWESDLLGKTLHELVGDGLNAKLSHMPTDARAKLTDALGRIINEGSGGLICILL